MTAGVAFGCVVGELRRVGFLVHGGEVAVATTARVRIADLDSPPAVLRADAPVAPSVDKTVWPVNVADGFGDELSVGDGDGEELLDEPLGEAAGLDAGPVDADAPALGDLAGLQVVLGAGVPEPGEPSVEWDRAPVPPCLP
jgi:hypothetical protein